MLCSRFRWRFCQRCVRRREILARRSRRSSARRFRSPESPVISRRRCSGKDAVAPVKRRTLTAPARFSCSILATRFHVRATGSWRRLPAMKRAARHTLSKHRSSSPARRFSGYAMDWAFCSMLRRASAWRDHSNRTTASTSYRHWSDSARRTGSRGRGERLSD